MISREERNAIEARRALLRQQTELLGPQLPWLSDATLIPEEAVDSSVAPDDVRLAAFSLAGWMLIEMVQAADRVYRELDWQQAIERFHVVAELQSSVYRAVLCPAARHAPGLFAIAEIVSTVPFVANRTGIARERWREIARRSESFGAMLARDGTAVQVLIRNYLSRAGTGVDGCSVRALNPASLRLDDLTGLTTVTPLADLLNAARDAVGRRNESYEAACVALQARAPKAGGAGSTTMFSAIWSSFADAADRLVFPRFDHRRDPVSPEVGPDPGYAETLGRLSAQWREELAQTASQPYPPSVERILENLLEASRSREPSL